MNRLWNCRVIASLLAVLVVLCAMTGCAKKGFDDKKNISVVTREDGSGTKAAFMELLGLKGKKDVSGAIVATGTAAVLSEVKNNPLAIAFESLGYVTDDVKILKVDGVAASVDAIAAGTYKIARPLQIVYQTEKASDPLRTAFLQFLQSDAAQKTATDNGYVAGVSNPGTYTADKALSGKLMISGSTSLQPLMLKLAAQFEELQPNVTVTVTGGGSGQGYTNAKEGVSDFGMISEEFKAEKAPGCTNLTVARDGIALIVNKENPIDNISMETLKNIYNCEAGSVAVRTWADAK